MYVHLSERCVDQRFTQLLSDKRHAAHRAYFQHAAVGYLHTV